MCGRNYNRLIRLLAFQVERPIRHSKKSIQTEDKNLEVINYFQLLLIKFQLYLFTLNSKLLIDHHQNARDTVHDKNP